MTDLRVTQAGVEAWAQNSSPAVRVTQLGVEVWATPSGAGTQLVLTQAGVEVWARVPAAGAVQARAMILA